MPPRIPAAVLRRNLGAIAASQAGYFTADQALGAGYEDANFGHHLGTGSWKRVTRGIYRLSDWPDQPGDDLLFWHLWSGGQAVASHLSAIEHWGLGQLEADRPHLTVSCTFRRAFPKQVRPAPVLHRRNLEWQRDVTFSDRGFKVTTVPRTIIDISPLVDADHLALTLQDAFSRGVTGESPAGIGVYGISSTGYGVYSAGVVYTTRFYELTEISTPVSPIANRARLFAKDNGLGKTQVCVKFANGTVKILATRDSGPGVACTLPIAAAVAA